MQPPAATSADRPDQGSRPPIPAAERGATTIPDRVVARIAARAAREALTTQNTASPAHLGLAAPQSAVSVGKGAARLALYLDLPYPVDLVDASRELQHYVSERVAQLTGLRVTEVTLTIQHLIPSGRLDHQRVH
ncbi:Asp23/Gls24 family envelope stress response protein [Streptomyces sp. NPDC095817]|uniref:Asp23/Gls24 family envelope stress response protein n=1 Tax=Streptomyces sp. NPDC095817 TaxID=3155082 RepID=UPI0033281309